MPKNLSDDPSIFPVQTSPVAGESRTAISIETPLQNSANRSAWLKSRLDYVDPSGNGARRLRAVTSIAALRALTDLTTGVCVVDGVGLYVYMPSSTATELEPFVVKPTSVGGGAGRWHWEALAALDVANGIPKLNGSARIDTSKLAASNGGAKILAPNVANGIVDKATTSGAGPFSTSSITYVDVGAIVISFAMEIGDIALLLGQAYGYQQDLTPANHFTQWLVTKPDMSTATVGTSELKMKSSALNEFNNIPVGSYFTASTAGTHTFKMQQKSEAASGGATVSVANLNVMALLIRP
jgi:hypothetical protein